MTLILNEADIERVLDMQTCLQAIRDAFTDLGNGEAVNRPRTHAYTKVGSGEYYTLKSMDGGSPRIGLHALRVSSEVSVETQISGRWRETKRPLARGGGYVGLVLLFDMASTELVAVLHDAGIQRLRVGATSGLAADLLARPAAKTVGLFGAGWQALPQLEALALVRPLEEVRVISTQRESAEAFAVEASDRLGIEVRAVASPEEAVRGADIIACATSSMEPVFDGSWLQPGQHVNSLQASELDNLTHERADVVCVRAVEESLHFRREADAWYRFAMEHQRDRIPDRSRMRTLGELLVGRSVGRTSEDQISLFGGSGTGPSSGLGLQFAAVGKVVLDRCRALGVGRDLPTEWFVEKHHP